MDVINNWRSSHTGHALKSSQGHRDWLRFFALMGSAIAIRETCTPVPDTPSKVRDLKTELRRYAHELDVEGHLRVYGAALRNLEEVNIKNAHYFLLELDTVDRSVKVTGYKAYEFEQAANDYLNVERSITETGTGDAVLVSAESFTALQRAYPNYFLDMHKFIEVVKQAIGSARRGKGKDERQGSLDFNGLTAEPQ